MDRDNELRLDREWMLTVLNSIGEAVITTDAAGVISFMNPVAEELTGCSADAAAGQPLLEVCGIIDELTRQPVESPVTRALRDGAATGLPSRVLLVRKDGTEIPINDSTAPIRDGGGAIVGVVLIFRNVSQQRRQQWRRGFLAQATIELNSSLDYKTTLATVARFAVPTMADWCAVDVLEGDRLRRLAVAHVDPAKIAWVQELERRFPPDPNATAGVPNILRTGKPEMIENIPAQLLDAAAVSEEHRQLIRQLSLRSYIGVPLNARGKTMGVISFVMAESGRHYDKDDLAVALQLADRAAVAIDNARLFGEMEKARAEAELANRSKDEFLAILGHELRNPLAPILTALQLMKLRAGDTFEWERTVIERQLKHVVRLVDDLLDVSRITRGKVELRREPVLISEVVAKAIEMSSPLLEERQHDVSVSVPSDLLVKGDEVRLAQVVANLLNNAAKYTEKGGHIAILAERSDEQVIVRVIDSGIGIAPEMMPLIFDLFVQERQALDRSQGGLGLGLAIVRSLVAMHGGSVSAHSAGLGHGTEVRVRLPALVLDKDAEPIAPKSRVSPQVRDAQAARILIVDDNVDAAQLLSEALERLGYETHVAYDGPSGLVLAKRVLPALAILDIGLPVMDGYELARQLRSLKGLENIRLVAISGYGQASDHAQSVSAGFHHHLVKPAEIQKVQAVLDRLLWSGEAKG